jgi:hypothetical protein
MEIVLCHCEELPKGVSSRMHLLILQGEQERIDVRSGQRLYLFWI